MDVLGYVGIALLAVLAFGAWQLWRLLRRARTLAILMEALGGDRASVSPSYVPINHVDWVTHRDIPEWNNAVLAAGFEQLGDYELADQQGPAMRLYRCDNPNVFAMLNAHPSTAPWLDLVAVLGNDEWLCVSAAPEMARAAPRLPSFEMVYVDGDTPVESMIGRVRSALNARIPSRQSEDDFIEQANRMMEANHRYMFTAEVSQDWIELLTEGAPIKLRGDEAAFINRHRARSAANQVG